MATTDQLVTSILDMSPDDAFQFVRDLRQSRRTPPEDWRKNAKKKNAKGTRDASAKIRGKATKIDPTTLAATMSKEQREAILKELGVKT